MLTFQIEKQRHEKTLIGSLQSKWKKALKKMGKPSLSSMGIALSIIMILAVLLFINMQNPKMSKQRNLKSGNWSHSPYAATTLPPQPRQDIPPSIPPIQPSSHAAAPASSTPPLPPPGPQYQSPPTTASLLPAAASVPLAQPSTITHNPSAVGASLQQYPSPGHPQPSQIGASQPMASPSMQQSGWYAADLNPLSFPQPPQYVPPSSGQQYPSPPAAASVPLAQKLHYGQPPLPIPATPIIQMQSSGAAPSQQIGQPQIAAAPPVPLTAEAASQPAAPPLPSTTGNALSAVMMPGQPHADAAAGSSPNLDAVDQAAPSPISQLLWQQQIMVQKCKEMPQGSISCRDLYDLEKFAARISRMDQQPGEQWAMMEEYQLELVSIFKEQFKAAAQQKSTIQFDFQLIFDDNCTEWDERQMISIGPAKDDGCYFYEFIRLLFSADAKPIMVKRTKRRAEMASWPRTVRDNLRWRLKQAFGVSYICNCKSLGDSATAGEGKFTCFASFK